MHGIGGASVSTGKQVDPEINEGLRVQENELLNPHSEPPELAAARSGNLEWLKTHIVNSPSMLCVTYRSGLHDGFTMPLIIMAAQKDNKEMVLWMLEQRADPNQKNSEGGSALSIAAQDGFTELVGLLLENKANPDLTDHKGRTALMLASTEGIVEVVKLLLKNKANPDLKNYQGATALMLASQCGNDNVVGLLLEGQADPNLQSKDGTTALMIACRFGRMEVAKKLLECRHIDINITNELGLKALFIAYIMQNENLVNLLCDQPDINYEAVFSGTDCTYEFGLFAGCLDKS